MNAMSLCKRHAAKPVPLVNIQNIRVASPCPADWNKMVGDERVRHCAECNLNVYNLSAMTEREIQTLITKSQGRLCGRIYRRADGTMLTQDCPRGLRAVARRVSRTVAAVMTAVMSVSFAFAGNKPEPQQSSQTSTQSGHSEPGIALTVTDLKGVPVVDAQVTLTDKKGKKKKKGTTNAKGQIFLPARPDNDYALEVTGPFDRCEKTVAVHDSKVENITIKIPFDQSRVTGGVIEMVSEAPIIETSESQVTTAFYGPSINVALSSRGGISPVRQ
ncbi:MAG TPA: carboxypeptidase-like regulatory domain-containing protein [Candidatus Angelobacter sp.]|nr:carboxypeptidase-like regulatory domain-containing protein [Candidatus Angelobacter sp.]